MLRAEGVRDDGAQMYTGLDQRTLAKRTSDRGSLKSPRSVLSKSLSGASGGSIASVGSARQLNGGAASPTGGSENGCGRPLSEGRLGCMQTSQLPTRCSIVVSEVL